MSNLNALKLNGIKFGQAARGANRLAFGLNVAVTGHDIYETCKTYGDGSRLCHKTAVADSAGLAAGQYAGGAAADYVADWAGCNAFLDFETAGAGILVCTVAIGLSSIAAGDVAESVVNTGAGDSYNYLSEKVGNAKPSSFGLGIIYQNEFLTPYGE